jgi:hypothetical protein
MRRSQLTLKVEASGPVRAPADHVYRLIADYRTGHPRIVPPQYFRNMVVESGEFGAGTIVSFEMLTLGSVQRARALVTEPEPGRMLVETIPESGIVTTFRVEANGPSESSVTISTEMPTRSGIAGALERAFIQWFLSRVYSAELAQIDRVAAPR